MGKTTIKQKKTALSIAIATTLTGLMAAPAQAYVLNLSYEGLFTMLDQTGSALMNTSYPYYDDPTWGYGYRSQISGTMSLDLDTGAGTGTITPFNFFMGGPAVPQDIAYQVIGGGLILGNMNFAWGANTMMNSVILDASGLFSALDTSGIGTVIDQASCVTLTCATPGSNDILKGSYPIGPVPIATTTFNTAGDIGYGTTINMLSLGTDDGVGGSPMQDSAFSGFSLNFDMTRIVIESAPTIPVPAAVWLFGSGLLGLVGMARRRKT